MNRSIEQALLSLLPTHNSNLPQPLTELASSLLVQSRHLASTLKAEEEVARLYACAHIACDRLKISLNLPPIDPRPPIPPRIYKRLYNHFEKILPSSSSTPGRATPGGRGTQSRTGTPGSRLRKNDINDSPTARKGTANANAFPLPSRTMPGKAKSLAQLRGTPAKATGPKLSSAEALPPWMRPTLRHICKENNHEKIGPVVMSGVESVVAPDGVITEDPWIRNNLVPLLGALYLYVWRPVTWPNRDLKEEEYVRFRKDLTAALNNAPKTVSVKSTSSSTATSSSGTPSKRKRPGSEAEEESWKGWRTVTIKEMDDATTYIRRHGWLELNWAKGIDDLVSQVLDGGREGEEDPQWVDGEDGDDAVLQAPLHVRRPDTMLQDRYDYLSERKLNEYKVWKKGILARIKELEKAEPSPIPEGVGLHVRTVEQTAASYEAEAAAKKARKEAKDYMEDEDQDDDDDMGSDDDMDTGGDSSTDGMDVDSDMPSDSDAASDS
ncbi:Origin recognition complex subunit 6 (ORC6) domain containing protein, partial [Naviculisporaceae sp. PSN 640]